MPLTHTDLVQPRGELSPRLFPGESTDEFEARLTEYLAQAYTVVIGLPSGSIDRAAAAFAYARAWDAVYTRMLTAPASFNADGQGSHSFLASQISNAQAERDRWTSLYDSLMALAVPDAVAPARVPSTVRTTVTLF